jgi:hypothetical protein
VTCVPVTAVDVIRLAHSSLGSALTMPFRVSAKPRSRVFPVHLSLAFGELFL